MLKKFFAVMVRLFCCGLGSVWFLVGVSGSVGLCLNGTFNIVMRDV